MGTIVIIANIINMRIKARLPGRKARISITIPPMNHNGPENHVFAATHLHLQESMVCGFPL